MDEKTRLTLKAVPSTFVDKVCEVRYGITTVLIMYCIEENGRRANQLKRCVLLKNKHNIHQFYFRERNHDSRKSRMARRFSQMFI